MLDNTLIKLNDLLKEICPVDTMDNFIDEETGEHWKKTQILSCRIGWAIDELKEDEDQSDVVSDLEEVQKIIDFISDLDLEANND